MAKNNNLTDFLTDVADAIRAKKGTSDLINPQDFSSEISSITTKDEGEFDDVNFFDYDGTLLHSMSWEQASTMSALPALPTREGFTCQGWNYTLDDIKSQSFHKCDVGATYITNDGKTRFHVRINGDYNSTNIMMRFRQTVANGISVDWGDGTSPSTYAATSYSTLSHRYERLGDYVITVTVNSGEVYFGQASQTDARYRVFLRNYYNLADLRKVDVGNNVIFEEGCFDPYGTQYAHEFSSNYRYHLSSMNIPLGYSETICNLKDIYVPFLVIPRGTTVMTNAPRCKMVSIPNTVTTTGSFFNNYGLERLCIPESVNNLSGGWASDALKEFYCKDTITLPTSSFSTCSSLDEEVIENLIFGNSIPDYFASNTNIRRITIPDGVKYIGPRAFSGCAFLEEIILPEGLEEIGESAFQGCSLLTSITLPSTLKTIGRSIFASCDSLESIVFPDGIETIPNYSLDMRSLRYVKFPKNLKSIGTDVLYYYNVSIICADFSDCLDVPSLAEYDFAQASSVIYVPDPLRSRWAVATNWSSSSSKITSRYAPLVLYSLEIIEAPDVLYSDTKAKVLCKAHIKASDRLNSSAEVDNIYVEWYAESEEFGTNDSSEPIERTVSVTYFGTTVTTTVTQGGIS